MEELLKVPTVPKESSLGKRKRKNKGGLIDMLESINLGNPLMLFFEAKKAKCRIQSMCIKRKLSVENPGEHLFEAYNYLVEHQANHPLPMLVSRCTNILKDLGDMFFGCQDALSSFIAKIDEISRYFDGEYFYRHKITTKNTEEPSDDIEYNQNCIAFAEDFLIYLYGKRISIKEPVNIK